MLRQPGCWLGSSHSFKECVTAHWSSVPARKMHGHQDGHRSYGSGASRGVGEHSNGVEVMLRGMVERLEKKM